MTGRGKKPIQQAQIKTRTPIKLMSTQTLAAPTIIPEQPYIGNAAMFLEPQTSSVASNSQELRNALSPMSSIAIDDINLNQKSIEPEQDDSSNRFLASLIAQGAAGIGTGLMGGSASDIQRSANLFDRMRDFEVNRQDRLKQNELLRTEKLTEKQDKLSEIKKREDQAKRLIDPNSEESKRDRLLYEKVLKTKIPEEVSADDLRNRPEIVKSLMAQAEQSRLAFMPRQGGGVGKPEKEIKSNQKSLADYKEHVSNVAEMSNVIDTIKKLNRTRIGGITPDFNLDTQAYSTSLDRAAQPMIKTLAGPGTLQKEERDTYGKLVPTGNTRSDLALRQANDIILDGTKISLGKMNTDLSIGNLNKKDYDTLINQYNEQLTKKGIGVNQVINPETGQLVPREKNESELKDGRKVLIDQFGYTWE